MTSILTNLFDGVAYGMLLFVLACGLSVTLGLMNFVNLAHGAFAMAGGYITLVLVNRLGVPFFAGHRMSVTSSPALRDRLVQPARVRIPGLFVSTAQCSMLPFLPFTSR